MEQAATTTDKSAANALGDYDDLPDEWVVATDIPTHLSVLDRDTRRSVAAFPTPDQRGWTVMGVANYSPDCPVLARGVSEVVARRTLRREADAVADGQPSTHSPDDVHDYKHCTRCNRQYARHPDLEVACPTCGAAIGQQCERPSGHSGPLVDYHAERNRTAVAEGVVLACPEGPTGDATAVRERCERELATGTAPMGSSEQTATDERDDSTDAGPTQATLDVWGDA